MAVDSSVHGAAGVAGFAYLAWERLETCLTIWARWLWACCSYRFFWRYMPTAGGRKSANSKFLLQDLQEHVGAAPSEEQLDQLFGHDCALAAQLQGTDRLLSKDAACAVSLDGTLRTVNKSVSDLNGTALYAAIVGQKFFDFLDEPNREQCGSRTEPRFLEKRHWAGTVRLRLKNECAASCTSIAF
jgi:hypothetical protein